MAIEAASGGATSPNALGLQDFMKILLTQLNHQDPLKPLDNQAFMAQMAQFSALEQGQRVNDKLEQLIGNHAALQSVALLGKQVEVQTSSGASSGTVSAVSLAAGFPVVSVTTSAGSVLDGVELARIRSIR